MGGSFYSDDDYAARQAFRASTNTPAFAYSAKTAQKPVSQQKAHATLDPKGVKVRESRDSAAHPDSNAVVVLFDVTGSMGEVPITIQKKLPTLMGLLLRKAYLNDPQILVAATGDAYTDAVPLQVGQFESGIEIEDCLTNIFLEGNGGGQTHETYELGLYFVARHTSIDCWEKRQKKGYMFIIGDEMPYDVIRKNQVLELIGDKLEADISVEDIIKEVQERYNLFFILPKMTHYYDNQQVNSKWKQLLGERFLKLEDPETVCELIAGTIGLCEENVDHDGLAQDLASTGLSTTSVNAVTTALSKSVGGKSVAKVPKGSGLVSV